MVRWYSMCVCPAVMSYKCGMLVQHVCVSCRHELQVWYVGTACVCVSCRHELQVWYVGTACVCVLPCLESAGTDDCLGECERAPHWSVQLQFFFLYYHLSYIISPIIPYSVDAAIPQ